MKDRFLLDAHVALSTQLLLQSFGYSFETVQDRLGDGASDEVIAELAKKERRVILTNDKGFGDIRRHPPADYFGIVVVRVKPLTTHRINRELRKFLMGMVGQQMKGKLFTINNSGVRVRP